MGCRVLILGHGTISEDIIRTAELVLAGSKSIRFINLPVNQDMDAYERQIEAIVKGNCESGLLIITDLLGGSPFLISAKIMERYWDKNVELVTGMNLPMIIEVIDNVDNTPISELKDMAYKAGIEGVYDFRSHFIGKEVDR